MDEVVRMLEGIDTTKGGDMILGDQAQVVFASGSITGLKDLYHVLRRWYTYI
ncbi:hypothetical protein Hanom_Chr05g00453051 [Helianthus anomalus]